MTKFVAILRDKNQDHLTRDIHFRHIDHLRTCSRQGSLLLAGPLKDQNRVIQIVRAESLEQARHVVDSDPYIANGIYGNYEMYELIEACEDNNWLLDTPRIQKMLSSLP